MYELVLSSTPSEVLIALLKDKQLVELHREPKDTVFAVGDIYLGKNSRGKTYINEDGNQTLLNDKSGYVGINMQGTMPDNNLHIKGDRPITVENTNPSSGTAGFLVASGEYFHDNHADLFMDESFRKHYDSNMFTGIEFEFMFYLIELYTIY